MIRRPLLYLMVVFVVFFSAYGIYLSIAGVLDGVVRLAAKGPARFVSRDSEPLLYWYSVAFTWFGGFAGLCLSVRVLRED